MFSVTSSIFSSIAFSLVGYITYIRKSVGDRFEKIEVDVIKHKIQLEKKMEKDDVKELVNDKLEAIRVTLDVVRNDIKEIKAHTKSLI